MHRTSLYDLHTRLGARMVEFAGWQMPVMYSGIIEEHLATRRGCTMFDVSHMGRLYLSGSDSATLLETLCTRRVADMQCGQARYTHICRQDGGILDDTIVSGLSEQHWLVVCNASNREKILNWITQHAADREVTIEDRTQVTAMLAIQGPETLDLAAEMLPVDVSDIKRYRFKTGRYMGMEYLCSRTGYTGEDGFEFILSSGAGRLLADSIFDEDGAVHERIKPAGLGARDTLRLEAGMPLYGHELHEQIDPISAGQAWCVNLDKDFIGGAALRQISETGPRQKLVGFEVEGRRIARQETPLEADGRPVGVVTSGTMSPTFDKVIGMGFVQADRAEVGTELQANIRGKRAGVKIVPLPFYKRPKKQPK